MHCTYIYRDQALKTGAPAHLTPMCSHVWSRGLWIQKLYLKHVHNVLSYPAHKQTNRHTRRDPITSEVRDFFCKCAEEFYSNYFSDAIQRMRDRLGLDG